MLNFDINSIVLPSLFPTDKADAEYEHDGLAPVAKPQFTHRAL